MNKNGGYSGPKRVAGGDPPKPPNTRGTLRPPINQFSIPHNGFQITTVDDRGLLTKVVVAVSRTTGKTDIAADATDAELRVAIEQLVKLNMSLMKKLEDR